MCNMLILTYRLDETHKAPIVQRPRTSPFHGGDGDSNSPGGIKQKKDRCKLTDLKAIGWIIIFNWPPSKQNDFNI